MESLESAVVQHFDQKLKIAALSGRTLILHTRNDDLVSVSHGERLFAWAGEPKEKLIFERGDHNTILAVNMHAYLHAVERFVLYLSE